MREFDSTGRKERLPSGQIAAQPFLTQLLQVQLANLVRRKGTSPSYLQGKSRLHLKYCVRQKIKWKNGGGAYLSFSLHQRKKMRKGLVTAYIDAHLRHSAQERATPLRFGCRATRELPFGSLRWP